MTPADPSEDRQNNGLENSLHLPPELIRVLMRHRTTGTKIRPQIEAAILAAGEEKMASIRSIGRRHFALGWVGVSVAAAACVALAFWLGRGDFSKQAAPAIVMQEEDAAAILLREFSALYPNAVKAIIQNSRGIQLTLADKPDVMPAQALVFKVYQGKGYEEIITFSGQNIEVAGHEVTVRMERDGSVVLDGEQFLWSSDLNTSPAPGIHIESRRL